MSYRRDQRRKTLRRLRAHEQIRSHHPKNCVCPYPDQIEFSDRMWVGLAIGVGATYMYHKRKVA